MPSRDQILDATARVYAEHGFRGATTRRIAEAAGVNEVTLFRTFGSKGALIQAALRHTGALEAPPSAALPDVPRDPERELTAWAVAQLSVLRGKRALIRQAMNDFAERPDAACTTQGWHAADTDLRQYLVRLGEHGFVPWGGGASDPEALRGTHLAAVPSGSQDEEILAAAQMFMAALFSDAMGREMMPGAYPHPPERAPALYVRLFLRALQCAGSAGRRTRRSPSRATRAPSSTEAA